MKFSKTTKLKLGFLKSWPLANKLRLAKILIPFKGKNERNHFDGISFLNKDTILATNTNNYLEYSIFTTGVYEPEVASLIKSQLYSGNIAIDVGANVGIHCLTMAKSVGKSGKVFAFEPVEYLRKKLEKNLLLNNISNVTILPFALSDKKDKVKVDFNPEAANLGTTSLGNTSEEGNEELIVEVGDELVASFQISNLDLIKIDVEGFELKVLQGLSNTIEKYHPRIIFEYDSNYIQRINDLDTDVNNVLFNFFESRKYSIFHIQEQGITHINSVKSLPTSGNLIAIHQFTTN